jgi:SAM-dependent methyltransferase
VLSGTVASTSDERAGSTRPGQYPEISQGGKAEGACTSDDGILACWWLSPAEQALAMSSDARWVMSKVPDGGGAALDLGGGDGRFYELLTARGYRYTNLDITPSGPGAVKGDAHDLPFSQSTFDLVVSCDSLEHFHDPLTVLKEVERVLKPGGTLVIWVPFLHPFHSTDYYRYTPLGIQHLLSTARLQLVSLEAPLGLFSVVAQAVLVELRRGRLVALERPIERAAEWLDQKLRRWQSGGSFALAYLTVARKAR